MDGQAHQMASEAAERIDRAREVGNQLHLFGLPQPVAEEPPGEARGAGRPAGARNKAKTGLRDLMVALGYRDPAQQLAFLAGLNTREDPYLVALGRAQAILAASGVGEGGVREQLPGLTLSILKEMRQASDAIMPYVFSKMTPDVIDQRTQMLIQMLAPGSQQAAAGAVGARLGPPPMPFPKVEQDQRVSEAASAQSDDGQSDGAAR